MAEKIFFANPEKAGRAKEILALILEEFQPRDSAEQEKKIRFGRYINEAKLDPAKKRDECERFVYELLGGLLWSEADKKAEAARIKEAKENARKKPIE